LSPGFLSNHHGKNEDKSSFEKIDSDLHAYTKLFSKQTQLNLRNRFFEKHDKSRFLKLFLLKLSAVDFRKQGIRKIFPKRFFLF
jgi:hypothetical protein